MKRLAAVALATLLVAGCGGGNAYKDKFRDAQADLASLQTQLDAAKLAETNAETAKIRAETDALEARRRAETAEADAKAARDAAATAVTERERAEEAAAAADRSAADALARATAAEAEAATAQQQLTAAQNERLAAEQRQERLEREAEEARQVAQSREANQRAEKLKQAFPGEDTTPGVLATISSTPSPVDVDAERGRLQLTSGGYRAATLSGSGLRTTTMDLVAGGDSGKTVVYTDQGNRI